jgi:hypothetical protein
LEPIRIDRWERKRAISNITSFLRKERTLNARADRCARAVPFCFENGIQTRVRVRARRANEFPCVTHHFFLDLTVQKFSYGTLQLIFLDKGRYHQYEYDKEEVEEETKAIVLRFFFFFINNIKPSDDDALRAPFWDSLC